MDSLLKAMAMALAVLAAAAEAAAGPSVPAAAAGDFLSSPVFLWVTANAIVVAIWLLSSYRRGGTNGDTAASSSAAGHDGEVMHDAVETMYTSASEYEYYEAFSDAGSARAADAAVSRRLAREERAARRADRPRVRKKPAAESAPSSRAARAAAAAARDLEEEIRRAETTTPVAVAADTEALPGSGADGNDDDEDVSMDSLWQSMVQRRAARPVVVQKSESWGNDELPRLERVAETAAATRREMRKSVSAVNKAPAPAVATQPPQAAAVRQMGWRTRDVLVTISPDDLLRRAESFIRRQREHLRLQRQESEQRQLQLQRRLHAPPPLIRV